MAGTASYGDLLVTSLVVLVAVTIAAFVVVRVVGRVLATGRVRGAHLLDVVARVPLEPRRSLYVVEVANKTLLVGTSEMGLSVLSELDAEEVRSRVVERPTFGELVKQAWARRKSRAPHAENVSAVTAAASSPIALDQDTVEDKAVEAKTVTDKTVTDKTVTDKTVTDRTDASKPAGPSDGIDKVTGKADPSTREGP